MGFEAAFPEQDEGGLSYAGWQAAAGILEAAGCIDQAEAIRNILAGADPGEEFCLQGLRAERLERRNRMIMDLFAEQYADQLAGGRLRPAVLQLERDWKDYAGRAGARDRMLDAPPDRYPAKWRAFWAINKLGLPVPGYRQLRTILYAVRV